MRSGATSNYLTYQIYKEAANTNIWTTGAAGGVVPNASTSKNSALTTASGAALTVFGKIPQNQDVTTGSYSDTVTITINF
jgi:spore coat protein U-like protein